MTLSRLLLLVVVIVFLYADSDLIKLLSVPLIIVMFVTDGLDGYLARKRNECSVFGALFDIAGDRIVELSLWIVAADQGLVPIWVPLIVIMRGVIIDTIRTSFAASRAETPFGLMRTRLGRFIVAGRFARGFYAVVKAIAFCGLAGLRPMPEVLPAVWNIFGTFWTIVTYTSTWLAVALCIVRGLPVIIEFVQAEKRRASSSPTRKVGGS